MAVVSVVENASIVERSNDVCLLLRLSRGRKRWLRTGSPGCSRAAYGVNLSLFPRPSVRDGLAARGPPGPPAGSNDLLDP